MNKFSKISTFISDWFGRPSAFFIALALILVWSIYASFDKFSTDSQMPINSLTTIITFLAVFLIQNTQNRNTLAVHAKLDELIRAIKDTDESIMDAEDLPEKEIKKVVSDLKSNRSQRPK